MAHAINPKRRITTKPLPTADWTPPVLTDEDLVDMFLNGHCGSYAVAAAAILENRGMTGVGISLLFDDDQEPNTSDGRGAIHAFVSCDGFDADARGVRTPADMAGEYGLMGWDVDGPYSPQELAAMFDEPIDIGIDPEAIAGAELMTTRNPGLLEPA